MNWSELFTETLCTHALEWLEENNFFAIQNAWEACHRGDWMLWALTYRVDKPLTKIERVEWGVRMVRETPVGDGRVVYDLLTDRRSVKAIEVAEQYIRGEAVESELISASVNADNAADDVNNTVKDATTARAAWAAQAAAWTVATKEDWAAWSAAGDAAAATGTEFKRAALKAQADIVRKYHPAF